MAWSLAPCLVTLRNQVNAVAPNRSKKSDGTIGDAAHAKTASDHNPNAQGIVCALDLTHDPANGFDADVFAEAQRKNPHPDLKYIVWRGRIASRKYNWTWRTSSGHFNHIHISAGVGSDGKSAPGTYNNTSLWNLGSKGNAMSADKLTKEEVLELHRTYFGSSPGAGYDFRHVGGTLGQLIKDWAYSPIELASRVNAKVAGKTTKLVEEGTVQPAPPAIDVNAIAEAVAEKLAERLKD